MYWFTVQDILSEHPDGLTSKEIFLLIAQKTGSANMNNLRRSLSKLVKSKSAPVQKDKVYIANSQGSHEEFVYFITQDEEQTVTTPSKQNI